MPNTKRLKVPDTQNLFTSLFIPWWGYGNGKLLCSDIKFLFCWFFICFTFYLILIILFQCMPFLVPFVFPFLSVFVWAVFGFWTPAVCHTLIRFAVHNWLNENGNEKTIKCTELNDVHAKSFESQGRRRNAKNANNEISSLLWPILCARFTYKVSVTSILLYGWNITEFRNRTSFAYIFWKMPKTENITSPNRAKTKFRLQHEAGKWRRLDRSREIKSHKIA